MLATSPLHSNWSQLALRHVKMCKQCVQTLGSHKLLVSSVTFTSYKSLIVLRSAGPTLVECVSNHSSKIRNLLFFRHFLLNSVQSFPPPPLHIARPQRHWCHLGHVWSSSHSRDRHPSLTLLLQIIYQTSPREATLPSLSSPAQTQDSCRSLQQDWMRCVGILLTLVVA